MTHVSISVAPELESVVSLGALAFDGLRVVEHDPRLDDSMARAADGRQDCEARQADVAAVRRMYRGLRLDPTKTRPSSEALLRRIRKGLPLPRINSLVDVCNWCSVEFQLPYGSYDRSRIDGDVVLRRGRTGDAYAGIRKDVVHVAGRPTLVDKLGPFGNPTSDSERTMVMPRTTQALIVIYAPRAIAPALLARRLDETAERVLEFVGGVEVGRHVA